jgi:bifunctional polynucleotide phosphatase/kinase
MKNIIKLNDFKLREKILALDYDGTLVIPKSGAPFPKDIDDWKWLRPNIPEIIKEYYSNGYCLMIFTNQSKSWKMEQVKNVILLLELPVAIAILDDDDKKPNPESFHDIVGKFKWNNKDSMFVGDALGRKNDFADSDRKFAKNIGMNVKAPEEVFPLTERNDKTIKESDEQEVVIMVGYPGSGKSTIANKFTNYVIISGDILKTLKAMLKETKKFLDEGKSVVIDATNGTKEKRSVFIDLANEYDIKVRCIYVATSLEESLTRNNLRTDDKIVPKIAFYVYRKKFEEPKNDEGCEVIIINEISDKLPQKEENKMQVGQHANMYKISIPNPFGYKTIEIWEDYEETIVEWMNTHIKVLQELLKKGDIILITKVGTIKIDGKILWDGKKFILC